MYRKNRILRTTASGICIVASVVGIAPSASSLPVSADSSQQVSLMTTTGQNLAADVESGEKRARGMSDKAHAKKSKLSASGAKSFDKSEKKLAEDVVVDLPGTRVSDVDVSVSGSKVKKKDSSGAIYVYDLKFTRDLEGIGPEDDWQEVVPYEVVVDAKGNVENITAHDLEWEISEGSLSAPQQGLVAKEPSSLVYASLAAPAVLKAALDNESANPFPTSEHWVAPAQPAVQPQASTVSAGPGSQDTSERRAVLASYSGSAGSAYAKQWWNSRNPAYPTFSNDCTNFISQAMKAGGWTEVSGFYQSESAWWSGGIPSASWTWSGAENWYRFSRNQSGRAYGLGNVYDLQYGDVLQYKGPDQVNMNHTMIVTKIYGGERYLTYHTNDTLNKPFTVLRNQLPNNTWFATRIRP